MLLQTATAWSGLSAVPSSMTMGIQREIKSVLLSPSLGVGMDFYSSRQVNARSLPAPVLVHNRSPGIDPAPGIILESMLRLHLSKQVLGDLLPVLFVFNEKG